MAGLAPEGLSGRAVPFGGGARSSSGSRSTVAATKARLEKACLTAALGAADARLAALREDFDKARGIRAHGAVVTEAQKLLAIGGYLLHRCTSLPSQTTPFARL